MSQQDLIFNRALQSNNPHAILEVAWAFGDLGEPDKAQALLKRAYSLESVMVNFGADYAAIQQKLNDKGANPPLAVDGAWGPKSKAALIAYQSANGLKPDGIPGPLTLGSLGLSGSVPSGSGSIVSTMGSTSPASAAADAKAYEIAKRAGTQAGYTEKEIQYTLTVGRGEGHFGAGWAHPSADTIAKSAQFGLTGYEGADSNNWGAVQGQGDAGSFMHVDTHADGSLYQNPYKKYSTPEKGYLDMARIILGGGKRGAVGAKEIKDAIAQGNLRKAVYAQHANGYFELNPEKYLEAVIRNYNSIMAGIGWPKVLAENGITPALATGGVGLVMGLAALGFYLWKRTHTP